MGLVKSWLFWEWLYHTASNLFCSSFNTPIFSPISTSMSAFVLTGGWYLLIIAQLILRYCSREGNDAFWMVLAKTLNCFSRAFTTSTIHRIFVMCLDSLASDDVNCRRPFKKGGKITFNPKSSMALIESRKRRSTTTMSSYEHEWSRQHLLNEKVTFLIQLNICFLLRTKMLFLIPESLFEKSDKNGPRQAMIRPVVETNIIGFYNDLLWNSLFRDF